MKRIPSSLAALIVIAGISARVGAAGPPATELSAAKAALGKAPVGMGFNMHIMGKDQDWDAIKVAGGKFIRKDFDWSGIEKTKGEYNFGGYDHLLDSLDAHGIRALLILDYRNSLYTNPETTDEGREAFAAWAAASAGHFKGRNVMWEIWNEPNVGFWKGKGGMNSAQYADGYLALVNKTVPAMRAADPDCYILGGAVSCLWKDSFRWCDEAFKQGLLKSGINALSVHPYGFPHPEEAINSGYGTLRDMLEKSGAPREYPVVDSEVGFPTSKKVTLDQQATLFVRQYLVDQMCGIPMTIFYNWDERDAATMHVRSTGPELLPVYNALKNMIAELDGYHFVERLKAGSNDDYVIAFANGSKGRKIVAWAFVKPQKGAKASPKESVADHEVAIPTGGTGGPVAVRDLYGKAVEARAASGTVTLNLSASPQYIDLSGERIQLRQ